MAGNSRQGRRRATPSSTPFQAGKRPFRDSFQKSGEKGETNSGVERLPTRSTDTENGCIGNNLYSIVDCLVNKLVDIVAIVQGINSASASHKNTHSTGAFSAFVSRTIKQLAWLRTAWVSTTRPPVHIRVKRDVKWP